MKKTHFNESAVDQFRHEFENLVKDFEEKHGVKFSLGTITYGLNQLHSKMTVTIVSEGENPEDVEGKVSLERHGFRFGLTDEDFNKRIHFLGDVYQLKGIKPRSRKYPILAKNMNNGQTYKLPVDCLGTT
jgi:hypothetical protein